MVAPLLLPYRIVKRGDVMNEKQRWLLKDLDAWRDKHQKSIGHWNSYDAPRPPAVRAMRGQIKKLEQQVKDWEKRQAEPFDRARQKLAEEYSRVKRIILFEKTDAALKAINGLK